MSSCAICRGVIGGSIGTILESLAVLQFNEKFDPQERVALANLTYHDTEGRTLGELDVVI